MLDRLTRVLSSAAVVLGSGGCYAAAAQPSSGIDGRVLIGPTCPVQRVGQSCERPYKTTIAVYRRGESRRVATVRSGSDGRFRVRLEPGEYALESTGGRYPSLRPYAVTVRAGRFTGVMLRFDTGIR